MSFYAFFRSVRSLSRSDSTTCPSPAAKNALIAERLNRRSMSEPWRPFTGNGIPA